MRSPILADQSKCRAGNDFSHTQRLTEALNETGLARTQVAYQANHVAGLQELPQTVAKALSLGYALADQLDGILA